MRVKHEFDPIFLSWLAENESKLPDDWKQALEFAQHAGEIRGIAAAHKVMLGTG